MAREQVAELSAKAAAVAAQIAHTGVFIDNKFSGGVNSNHGVFETCDPATGARICVVEAGTVADVDAAVAAAVRAGKPGSAWRQMSGAQRGALLRKLADLLERDAEWMADLEALDSGKPRRMARFADVDSALAVLRHHAGYADGRALQGATLPIGTNHSSDNGVSSSSMLAYTKVDPVGVVAGILPFNFPLCGAVAKLAPALAAGCTIVLKPAEQCPLTPLALCALVAEAGFPPGVVNAVPGDAVPGAALAAHPDVRKVSFTGSNAVGKSILRVAAERCARVTLELGGKNACIICPDADIETAARIAVGGNFFNSGQICVGISRVLIPDSMYDAFLEEVRTRAESRILGNQWAEEAEQGPLVDAEQMARVLKYIELGIRDGARVVCGGKRHGTQGFFVEPTVLADVDDDNVVAKEEIFGPVMCCQRYAADDVAEAIRRANATPYGLAGVVVASDINIALAAAHSLDAGTVWVNNHGCFDPAAPYGGHKESGLGREYGIEGLAAYTESKTVMVALPGLP